MELDVTLTEKIFAINLSIVKLTSNITFERGDFEPGANLFIFILVVSGGFLFSKS